MILFITKNKKINNINENLSNAESCIDNNGKKIK